MDILWVIPSCHTRHYSFHIGYFLYAKDRAKDRVIFLHMADFFINFALNLAMRGTSEED